MGKVEHRVEGVGGGDHAEGDLVRIAVFNVLTVNQLIVNNFNRIALFVFFSLGLLLIECAVDHDCAFVSCCDKHTDVKLIAIVDEILSCHLFELDDFLRRLVCDVNYVVICIHVVVRVFKGD